MLDLFTLCVSAAAFIAALIDTSLGMCYGTILAPILLIAGYPPGVTVPTILFSQLIVDIAGGLTHVKVKNFTKKDVKTALLVAIPAAVLVPLGVFLNISLPVIVTKTYVGLLVTTLGLLLLLGISFKKRSSSGLLLISGIAGFNKGFIGGGFGPVVVSGQVVFNYNDRSSVSIGDIAEIPVCIVGLLAFALQGKLTFLPIYLAVTIPALIAALIGPHITLAFSRKGLLRRIIGVTTLLLGITTLMKIILG